MSEYTPKLSLITERTEEVPGTVTFTVPIEGKRAEPGQFYMLHSFGVGEVPISISNIDHSDSGSNLDFTIRAAGKVSTALSHLQIGDPIGYRGPYGNSWPIEKAKGRDVLVIAGGIGIAPLRPMILRIIENRSDFEKVVVLYGTRTPQDILFSEQQLYWKREAKINLQVSVDIATPEWYGHVGVVTEMIHHVAFDPNSVATYVCGPEVMMHFVAKELQACKVGSSQVYLSLERNMHCAVAHCGRCMLGPTFVCKDGPIFSYDYIAPFLETREM